MHLQVQLRYGPGNGSKLAVAACERHRGMHIRQIGLLGAIITSSLDWLGNMLACSRDARQQCYKQQGSEGCFSVSNTALVVARCRCIQGNSLLAKLQAPPPCLSQCGTVCTVTVLSLVAITLLYHRVTDYIL